MLRHSIAIAAGFILWSFLWLGYNMVLQSMAMLPTDDTKQIESVASLLSLLLGSIVASVIAGYVTAAIGRTPTNVPTLVLGLLLLATGVAVQSQYWQLMPVWYHVLFLGLLLPGCFIGSRSRSA